MENGAIVMSKFALGTVQFGIPYGISNVRGQVPACEVAQILRLASASGVDLLDTAQAYGTSETILGGAIFSEKLNFKIVTKLRRENNNGKVSISSSLRRLNQSSLYGVMLHSFDEYCQAPEIYSDLLRAKMAGLVAKTGFSVYSPVQLEKIIADKVPFDIVQFPYNIFDRRFDVIMPLLKDMGVELHVRSVFLQGLLLMVPTALPNYFNSVSSKLLSLHATAAACGISMPMLCLSAVKSNKYIDKIVVGVASLKELQANLDSFSSVPNLDGCIAVEIQKCQVDDEQIINPAFWKRA